VIIPTSFSTYAVDWSHFNIDQGNYNDASSAYLNDVLCSHIDGKTVAQYGSFSGLLDNGIEHTVKISAQRDAIGRIGLVLEYAE